MMEVTAKMLATKIWTYSRDGVYNHPNKRHVEEVVNFADFNSFPAESQKAILEIEKMIQKEIDRGFKF